MFDQMKFLLGNENSRCWPNLNPFELRERLHHWLLTRPHLIHIAERSFVYKPISESYFINGILQNYWRAALHESFSWDFLKGCFEVLELLVRINVHYWVIKLVWRPMCIDSSNKTVSTSIILSEMKNIVPAFVSRNWKQLGNLKIFISVVDAVRKFS